METKEILDRLLRQAAEDTTRNLFFGVVPSATSDDLPDSDDDDEEEENGDYPPTIDSVIQELQKLKAEHGNLPVYFNDNEYGCCGFYFQTQDYNGRKVLTIED